MITGLLSDLDLDRFDIEQTRDNIEASWLRNDGIVFPLVDNGALLTRSYPQLKIEDFVGAFYVKTIFNQIFVEAGIKIQGELLSDWMYNNIICLKNSKSQEEINARSSYVFTNNSPRAAESVPIKTLWTDDFSYPYYDGSQNCFDLPNSRYIPDTRVRVQIEVNLVTTYVLASVNIIFAYVNGVAVKSTVNLFTDHSTFNEKITLEAGDVLEIYSQWSSLFHTADDHIISGTVKITPTFIYKTFGKSAPPNWTKQQFVSNILRQFNVLASYEEGSHTLTFNLFEKIKDKTPIDLSEYISETEVDYSEFISDYGQNSILSYNEVEFDELKSYNTSKYFKYSQGSIRVNNDFLEPNVSIIESDFSNPIAYINGMFDMSIEKTNLLELEEADETEVTSVTDASGNARFNIAEDIFLVGDLVRIKDSTNTGYNGDWVVTAVSAGWIECLGTSFDTSATATIIKLDFVYSNSDDAYLLVNIPNYEITKFSGNTFFYLEDVGRISFALGYFDIINTGRQVNLDFIYSLSFGGIDDPLHYQTTMIESYFRLFSRVLNDPVKLFCTAHLPYGVFVGIDFLSPITIKTLESTNQYYLNRISGYKESFLSCQLELIKLA